jgi:hypothetical protein
MRSVHRKQVPVGQIGSVSMQKSCTVRPEIPSRYAFGQSLFSVDYTPRSGLTIRIHRIRWRPNFRFTLRDLCDLGGSAVSNGFNTFTAEMQRTRRWRRELQNRALHQARV